MVVDFYFPALKLVNNLPWDPTFDMVANFFNLRVGRNFCNLKNAVTKHSKDFMFIESIKGIYDEFGVPS